MKYWGFWLTMFFLMVLPAGILAEAGVESRKIVLGTHQPLSGPMKNYAQIGRGASIYFQYLNDQGGIHGRQLFLLQRDDRFKPQRTLKLVEELVMKDRVFALFSGIGTETSESAMPLLKSQGVPHFFIGSNARSITEPPRHGIFSMLPTPEVEARVLGQYVNSNHPGEKVILWFRDEPEYKAASKEIAQKLQGNPLQFLPSKAGSSQFKAEWEAIQAGKSESGDRPWAIRPPDQVSESCRCFRHADLHRECPGRQQFVADAGFQDHQPSQGFDKLPFADRKQSSRYSAASGTAQGICSRF